ncbi:MAG: FAD-dependent oxidoreductase, partial [Pirellulaceae bacterium]
MIGKLLWILSLTVFASACTSTAVAQQAEPVYDLVVYGGTSGGIAAAIQARRMGKTAIVVEPSQHVGGLT